MKILHKHIGTSQTPNGAGVPSNKKPNIKPYQDDKDSSESMSEIEVTVDNNKKNNQKPHYDRLTHGEMSLH